MDCATCGGACCEGPIAAVLPAVLPTDVARWKALREDGRCRALTAEGRCAIYRARPLVCATFARGGRDCLEIVRARRSPAQYRAIREPGDPEEA